MRFLLSFLLSAACFIQAAEENYPVHEDSKVHEGVSKGEMIKASYTAADSSVFPGTEREYQLYIPAGLDKSKPAPFMVFQDGVIYNAPVVFDNLIAKKEIPAMIGIFIKPGVVPAANPEALPRFNRSYEYDSVSAAYSSFLIHEFLPAIMQKHAITLSTDPNDAGISGNSSGGICAFMVAWHRSDRFRRVFTGVGTYVGIHGADQLPVLVRKMEPKPIKVYLQSGENDNNLYCGDWWMANQMMERSLTWAGYDVAHTWGTGGHNGKQATAIFPDVMRWLWKGYPEAKEIKANPEGKSKWLGYQVLKEGSEWEVVASGLEDQIDFATYLRSSSDGVVYFGPKGAQEVEAKQREELIKNPAFESDRTQIDIVGKIAPDGVVSEIKFPHELGAFTPGPDNSWVWVEFVDDKCSLIHSAGNTRKYIDEDRGTQELAVSYDGSVIAYSRNGLSHRSFKRDMPLYEWPNRPGHHVEVGGVCFTPDQSFIYVSDRLRNVVFSVQIAPEGGFRSEQIFCYLQQENGFDVYPGGICVDAEGRVYISTDLGIQVCDQAGRVNFIIPTPQDPRDICFGGKELSELFIACGDKIYKRQTKVHGVVSGQQPPIKPAPPKL